MVGRWGYGAYHKDEDLARTAAAARGQCGQPVVINRGSNGGVMMYLADSAQLQELQLKGSQSGKNYIGPPGDPGGPQDREIVSFDGRTMVLRGWIRKSPAATALASMCVAPPRHRTRRRPSADEAAGGAVALVFRIAEKRQVKIHDHRRWLWIPGFSLRSAPE